jgi:hypothetical protein
MQRQMRAVLNLLLNGIESSEKEFGYPHPWRAGAERQLKEALEDMADLREHQRRVNRGEA